MPRPSRRDELLRAALRRFATDGVAGTRVRDVAAEAGMSDAALYRHFPSLDALADAVFAERMGHLGRTLQAAADAPGDVAARFSAAAGVILDAHRDDPDAFLFVIDEQPRRMSRLPAGFPYPVRVLAGLLASGQAEDAVRPGDPRLLAAMALGCLVRPAIVARHAAAHRPLHLDDPGSRAVLLAGAWGAVAADR